MTITVELLRDDALDLIRQFESLAVLRIIKIEAVEIPEKNDITKLYGTLKTGLTVDEIEIELKNLRNEWERDFS